MIYIPNGVPELPPGDRDASRAGARDRRPGAPVVGTVAQPAPGEGARGAGRGGGDRCAATTPDLRVADRRRGPRARAARAADRRARARGARPAARLPRRRRPTCSRPSTSRSAARTSRAGRSRSWSTWTPALPIVATRVGGLPELLDEGDCGAAGRAARPASAGRGASARCSRDPRAPRGARCRAPARKRERRYGLDDLGARIEALYADAARPPSATLQTPHVAGDHLRQRVALDDPLARRARRARGALGRQRQELGERPGERSGRRTGDDPAGVADQLRARRRTSVDDDRDPARHRLADHERQRLAGRRERATRRSRDRGASTSRRSPSSRTRSPSGRASRASSAFGVVDARRRRGRSAPRGPARRRAPPRRAGVRWSFIG